MSKQNRANPKYILIASPSHKIRQINSVSLHSKSHFTLPNHNKKQDSFKANVGKGTVASFNKDAQKDVETIRKDLTECVNNIAGEQKKNKIYKQLIDVLQGEMKKLQQEQKQINKVQDEQTLKKIGKLQYDIEQILQKHNEEVARINSLKEQVSSARSDRVVFSNLFKKIEKEIKQNEEHYNSLIAKTQTSRQHLSLKQLAEQNNTKLQSLDQFEFKDENRQFSNKTTRRQNFIFLTHPTSNNAFKKPSNQPTNQSLPTSPSSKDIQYLIEQTEAKIQKILKLVECQSCQQAQRFYTQIEGENSKLSQLIWEEDKKIGGVQEQIERIKLQKRISQIYQSKHLSKLQSLSSNRKIRSIKHIHTTITQSTERQDQNIEIISNVLDLLGILHSQEQGQMMNDSEIMLQLQRKIEDVCKPQSIKKSDSNLTLTLSNVHEQNLQNILARMQKFQNCERIFTKDHFCNQYTKEVSKHKRVKVRK